MTERTSLVPSAAKRRMRASSFLIIPKSSVIPTTVGKIETIQIDTGMASADSQPEPVAEVAEAVAEVESAQKEEKEETPKTGMAALLARRPEPKKRLDTLAGSQDIYKSIYNRPFRTV